MKMVSENLEEDMFWTQLSFFLPSSNERNFNHGDDLIIFWETKYSSEFIYTSKIVSGLVKF